MNKKAIDRLIPFAYSAISDCGIAQKGVVNKTYRGQISTFGASIHMGSLLAAISFFSDDGNSSVNRVKLLDALA